jgi:hypothetical protein
VSRDASGAIRGHPSDAVLRRQSTMNKFRTNCFPMQRCPVFAPLIASTFCVVG